MLQNSLKLLSAGAMLLCSTAYSQTYYPTAQQPMAGAPVQRMVSQGAPAYQAVPQPVYGSAHLPPPTTVSGGATTVPYGGPYASQPMQVTPVHLGVANPSCGSGNCGPQPVAGYGAGGAVATGVPYGSYGQGLIQIPTSGQTSGGSGFFFRYDRLYSTISRSGGARAVGSANAEGISYFGGGATAFQNSFDTSFLDDDEFEFNGDRIEFGFLDGTGCDCGRCGAGWVASIISLDQDIAVSTAGGQLLFDDPFGILFGYADGNGDGIDDDINSNNVYGRFGEDRGVPDPNLDNVITPGPPYDGIIDGPSPFGDDQGDLVRWIPIFDQLSVRSRTTISGLALSRFRASRRGFGAGGPGGCGGRCFRWLYGVRYMQFRDRFSIDADGGFFPEMQIDLDGTARNFLIGPEVGFCLGRTVGPWSFSGQLRFTPAVNFSRTSMQGAAFTGIDGSMVTGQNHPLGLTAITVNSNENSETFTALGEWRAEVGYALTKCLSVRAGYTGMYLGEIASGTNLNFQLPDFSVSGQRDDIYVHALTLGGEFVY